MFLIEYADILVYKNRHSLIFLPQLIYANNTLTLQWVMIMITTTFLF